MDKAIPILPTVDYDATVKEYKALGFEVETHHRANGYLIVNLGEFEIHFFTHSELDPNDNYSGCYIRTNLADELNQEWAKIVPQRTGRPRLEIIENKPWNMREFAYVDTSGNLLRIGYVNE